MDAAHQVVSSFRHIQYGSCSPPTPPTPLHPPTDLVHSKVQHYVRTDCDKRIIPADRSSPADFRNVITPKDGSTRLCDGALHIERRRYGYIHPGELVKVKLADLRGLQECVRFRFALDILSMG
jgi:hypothetical protein